MAGPATAWQATHFAFPKKSNAPRFCARVSAVHAGLQRYMAERAWFHQAHPDEGESLVAYFTAECGLTECLPVYAGGLGILSGDHLKAASALGVPLVGVSLLYQLGYSRQMLDASGWQIDSYPSNSFEIMPLRIERTAEGWPLTVEVPLPGRPLHLLVWRAQQHRRLADDIAEARRAHGGQLAPDVLGQGQDVALDQIGSTGESRPQVVALGGDARRARIEVALTGHVAAERHEERRAQGELLGSQERRDDDVATGSEATVGAQHDPIAQSGLDERLVDLGEAQLPGCPDVLDRGQR